MENLGYLIAAFGVVWLGIALYVAWVGSQTAQLRRDLRGLRELLEEDQATGGSAR
jgi:CcmD family protein